MKNENGRIENSIRKKLDGKSIMRIRIYMGMNEKQ